MSHVPATPVQRLKLTVLIVATIALALFLWTRRSFGTEYFSLGVDRAPFWPLVPALVICLGLFFFAQYANDRLAWPMWLTVPLLMLSLIAMQLAASSLHFGAFDGFDDVILTVENPTATSYLQDAGVLLQEEPSIRRILASYPERMPHLHLHSRTKPPGPVVFYMLFIRLFGPLHAASLAGGLCVGLLSSLTLPAACWLVRALTHSRTAAFGAASFLVLAPSLIVLLPQLDLVYGFFTGSFLAAWVLAIDTRRVSMALVCGVVFSLMVFATYNLLVLGAFVAGYAALQVHRHHRPALGNVLRQTFIILLTTGLCYTLLWLASGYRPIATFTTAIRNQVFFTELNRPWPDTIPGDLMEFAFAAGGLAVLLIVFYFIHRRHEETVHLLPIVILCLAQPLVVALTGLLRTETFRVWTFMLPLLAVPIGLELSRWPRRHRWIAYGCMGLIAILVAQSMPRPCSKPPAPRPALSSEGTVAYRSQQS